MNRTDAQRRWLKWTLAASLVLNGFLIGWITSTYLTAQPARRGLLSYELRSLGKNLPDAEREALRQTVRDLLPQMRKRWARLRELRREIHEIAARPDPDRAAIDARLAEIRRTTSAIQEAVQSRLYDNVMALPPEIRMKLGAVK